VIYRVPREHSKRIPLRCVLAGLAPIQNTLSQKKIGLGHSGAVPVHVSGFIRRTVRRLFKLWEECFRTIRFNIRLDENRPWHGKEPKH